ncbi:hypothetical protein INR49_001664 [Caranx melampygus]|nr:hypothetical protein INR49_001664 [Caranx melampygus]
MGGPSHSLPLSLLVVVVVLLLLLQAAGVAVTMISSPLHTHTAEEREQTRRYHDAMASGWKTHSHTQRRKTWAGVCPQFEPSVN